MSTLRTRRHACRPSHDLALETLEPRALLSAPVPHFVSATANATALFVVVDYSSDTGMDLSTLGQGDLQLATNGQSNIAADLFSSPTVQPNGDVRAFYIFQAYNGAWNYTNSGTYIVTSPAGQVQDAQHQNLSTTFISQNYLWFSTPRATLQSTTVEANDWLVVVNYTDDASINTASLDDSDVGITGQGLFPGIRLLSVNAASANNVTATYRIPARDGAWNYTHTGAYTITLNNNQVSDGASNTIPAVNLGSFYLWFDKPAAQVQNTTVGTNTWVIPVRYSGRAPIDTTSIAEGDITVTGPNGFSADGHLLISTNNGDGTYTASYQVVAPGGSWDYSDNGTYAISVKANRVHDTAARFVAGTQIGSFYLWFSNPAATLSLPTNATPTRWDFSVRFSDNSVLDTSSVTSNSVRVVGPGNINMAVTLLSTSTDQSGGTIATFRLVPSGASLANGHYEIWTNPNQTHDTQNNFVYENSIGSFWLFF